MRAFLIALLVLLWLLLGWWYNKDYNRCCTGAADTTSSVVPAPAVDLKVKSGPILFNWGKSTPVLGEGWSAMRDSILATIQGNKSLEIAGWYCENGEPDENEALALARAQEVRKLFSELPDNKVNLITKVITCDSTTRTSLFESIAFGTRVTTEQIKEIDDRTLIYFPSNSNKKLNSQDVNSYLDDVAARVTKSGETVTLTGHTDSVGPEDSNNALGLSRANIIRDYLVSKGVAKDKIRTTSKGESEPIADNSTDEGRAKNRRTELQIIK
ncbi:MAG: OmpA family protein [Saprospiraceae bacterium]